jgi:NDP-sugar pyrophosphorylase family protein
MNGLIFCAGNGKRLRPLTWFTPKPMLKIHGKPVLEYIINSLEYFGVNNLMINVHNKPEVFIKHFGKKILYFYESELLGEKKTLERINELYPYFTNDFLLIRNGDTITNLDVLDMFRKSNGKSIRHVDKNGVYAGTSILAPDYFKGNKKMIDYKNKFVWWIDMGTFKGLYKARRILR